MAIYQTEASFLTSTSSLSVSSLQDWWLYFVQSSLVYQVRMYFVQSIQLEGCEDFYFSPFRAITNNSSQSWPFYQNISTFPNRSLRFQIAPSWELLFGNDIYGGFLTFFWKFEVRTILTILKLKGFNVLSWSSRSVSGTLLLRLSCAGLWIHWLIHEQFRSQCSQILSQLLSWWHTYLA